MVNESHRTCQRQGRARIAHAVEDADDYLLETWTFLLILDQLIAIKWLYLGRNAIRIVCLVGGEEFDVLACK
jgi:hypothetical protein